MPTWGEPETITAADLADGDFVLRLEPARRAAARDVGSGVAALDWDYQPGRPGVILRVVTFLDRTTVAIPVTRELVVRRRAGSGEAAA